MVGITLCGLLGAFAATAQTAAPAKACESPLHRAFDFWIGEWEVTGGPKLDQIVGRNRIERAADGCALYEHWVNANDKDGRSLNAVDPKTREWTQFWIGSDGVILRLAGGLDGADMLLQGSLPTSAGGSQLQRIRWTPRADGSVVQRWETSDDAGASWQISFVGVYRRLESRNDARMN